MVKSPRRYRTQRHLHRGAVVAPHQGVLIALAAAVVGIRSGGAPAQDGGAAQVTLARETELARLVDLAAQQIGLAVEYDARALQGITVTARLGQAVSKEALWALANQLLAARGFTTVQPSGEEVLSVVKLTDAAGIARIEPWIPPAAGAGFVTVMVPVVHRPVKEVIDAIKPLISKPGGAVNSLGDEPRILLSDLRPRVEEILSVLSLLDAPGAGVIVERVPAEYLEATQLGSLVTAAVTAWNVVADRPLAGKAMPIPEGNAVVLIAPPPERAHWLELIDRLDERQGVTTRTYAPRYFSISQVAPLLEQTARDPGPRGAGNQWKVVTDDLTGALIVTATPAEHERIQALVERLNAVPVDARRPVRAFRIRNRGVREIVEILSQLIEAGALEAGEIEGQPVATAAGEARQRTERQVLPPGAVSEAIPGIGRGAAAPEVPAHDASVGPAPPKPATGGQSLLLTADEGTNTLIVIGDARRLEQLAELIRTLDERQPQVMLEALVLSLSEGDTLDLGVELEVMAVSGSTLINLASIFDLGMVGLEDTPAPSGTGGTALVLSPGDFRVLVRALETINHGRALNIPKVLVNNNQQATLDAVLQQPFLSTNASTTVATTSFGGTQDAGTSVSVTPQIAEGDHLVLEYSLSLSAFVGESSDPALPPPRQQNTIQSVVTIPDGYTIVVGGLEVETTAQATSQVPGLGALPLVGELFKNRSNSRSRSRFYLFIRANILRHHGFEDLKYLSDRQLMAQGVHLDDGWPKVEPRIIR